MFVKSNGVFSVFFSIMTVFIDKRTKKGLSQKAAP